MLTVRCKVDKRYGSRKKKERKGPYYVGRNDREGCQKPFWAVEELLKGVDATLCTHQEETWRRKEKMSMLIERQYVSVPIHTRLFESILILRRPLATVMERRDDISENTVRRSSISWWFSTNECLRSTGQRHCERVHNVPGTTTNRETVPSVCFGIWWFFKRLTLYVNQPVPGLTVNVGEYLITWPSNKAIKKRAEQWHFEPNKEIDDDVMTINEIRVPWDENTMNEIYYFELYTPEWYIELSHYLLCCRTSSKGSERRTFRQKSCPRLIKRMKQKAENEANGREASLLYLYRVCLRDIGWRIGQRWRCLLHAIYKNDLQAPLLQHPTMILSAIRDKA